MMKFKFFVYNDIWYYIFLTKCVKIIEIKNMLKVEKLSYYLDVILMYISITLWYNKK